MTQPRVSAHRARIVGTVMASALLLMGACTPHVSNWSPVTNPKENKVAWVTFNHVVAFAPGRDGLDRRTRDAILHFLRDHDVRNSDRVFVGSTGRLIDDRAADLADRRSAAVASFLRHNRIFPRALPETPIRQPWDGRIALVIGRYVVTPPNCPDWSKPATGDPANRESSNFGCATATNLGLMVADPGDLVRGTPAGPSDAEAAGRAIQRYREGEIRKTKKEEKRLETTEELKSR